MTHTKGPWRVDNDGYSYEISIVGKPGKGFRRFRVDGEWEVATLKDDDALPLEEVRANARLIAAAPDLLEALEKVLRYNEGRGEFNFLGLSDFDRANECFDAWQVIKAEIVAAIAKAKGEA